MSYSSCSEISMWWQLCECRSFIMHTIYQDKVNIGIWFQATNLFVRSKQSTIKLFGNSWCRIQIGHTYCFPVNLCSLACLLRIIQTERPFGFWNIFSPSSIDLCGMGSWTVSIPIRQCFRWLRTGMANKRPVFCTNISLGLFERKVLTVGTVLKSSPLDQIQYKSSVFWQKSIIWRTILTDCQGVGRSPLIPAFSNRILVQRNLFGPWI